VTVSAVFVMRLCVRLLLLRRSPPPPKSLLLKYLHIIMPARSLNTDLNPAFKSCRLLESDRQRCLRDEAAREAAASSVAASSVTPQEGWWASMVFVDTKV
jgi:hypothetical protein